MQRSKLSEAEGQRKERDKANQRKVYLPEIVVDGIMWDEKSPLAVLKNKEDGETRIVQKGDTLWGAKVLCVLRDSVKIQFDKKVYFVK
ncbi:MAG: hypothetical protein AB1633_07240 [Elusimicrobiota bacterium]